MAMMRPRFFATPERFRAWLQRNHETAGELWVGFYKKVSGRPSITWPEAVDEALCFGWIDGIRKRVDDASYMNRFTPRKPTSNWSAKNVQRVRELIDEGRMTPAGLRAFEARKANRTGIYSYERRPQDLPAKYARPFRANARAWKSWRDMPPGYRKAATWWVTSAKKEDTRQRRLATLIETTARGDRIPALTPPDRR